MLSRLVSQNKLSMLVNNAARSFRATQTLDKKPSIGDAVTILQSKVSSINQVVSTLFSAVGRVVRYPCSPFEYRMTSRSSELSSQSVMVLQESSVS